MAKADSNLKAGVKTRAHILRAALKHFANAGYAATSVQQIVSAAKVSKPALYYHFRDKSELFKALVHEAHDERFRLLREAAARGKNIREQLENILTTLFDYVGKNRELMRISFATNFAAPGEVPENLCYGDKCERNFEFVHSLVKAAQKRGELNKHFDTHEMAFGIYGLTNFYLVSHMAERNYRPDRKAARRIVELFLTGAAAKKTKSKN
ncbi:MAG: TetR/AcrR family transcriptional regulator [Limisphaerales bacterium]